MADPLEALFYQAHDETTAPASDPLELLFYQAHDEPQPFNLVDTAKQLGTGAIEGIGGLGAMMMDLNPFAIASDPLNRSGLHAGLAWDEKGDLKFSMPISEKFQSLVDEYLPAKSTNENRYARTIGQFVGPGGVAKAGAKAMGVAAPVIIDSLLGTTAANVVGGVGAQAAEDLTGDQTIAPILGAGLLSAGPSIFSNLKSGARSLFRGATPEEVKGSASLVLKEATDLTPESLQAAIAAAPKDDLGKLMTTAEITGDAGIAQLEKTLAAKDKQAIQYAQAAEARNQARNAIVSSLAEVPSVHPERLGTDLISKANEIEQGFASVAQQIWDQVPRRAAVAVRPEQRAIKSILTSRQGGLAPGSKVSTLVEQFLESGQSKKTGVLTSGALQDIRSDALTLLRDANITPFETRLLSAIQNGADSAMERSLTGDAYDTWKAARSATAMQKETFGRGTAGGALVNETARPSTVLGTAIKGDKQSIDELARAVGGDGELLEGVKRSMLDSIKLDTQDNLTLYQTRKFIGQNEGAIKTLFGDDGYSALKRIAEDLKSEAKVNLTANLASKGNSVTAQKQTVAGAIDQLLSESVVPGAGPLSGIANSVRETVGIRDKQAVREMIFKAALDPNFALELAKTPTTKRIFNMLERLQLMGQEAGTAAGSAMVRELSRTEETNDQKKGQRGIAILSRSPGEGSGQTKTPSKDMRRSAGEGRSEIESFQGASPGRRADLLPTLLQGTGMLESSPRASNVSERFPSPNSDTTPSKIEAIFSALGEANPFAVRPAYASTGRGNTVEKPKGQGELDLILEAIRQVESAGGKYTTGPETKYGVARGSYQVLDSTGKEYFKKLGLEGKYDPYDEAQQKVIAQAVLEDYMRIFDGDINKAVLAYHTGPGNVKAGKIGPQGRAYLPKVEAALQKLTQV